MELKKEIELLKEKIRLLERQKELEEDLIELKRLSKDLYPQPQIVPMPYPVYPEPCPPYQPWSTGDPLPINPTIICADGTYKTGSVIN